MKRLINSVGNGYMPSNDIRVPTTDYSDIEENHRSYVYPACGHTYSYHKSLEGKSCPLCRTYGPYVPIAFEFEPAICTKKPTHVFNPCGHVASLEACKYWSELKVYTHDLNEIRAKHLCSQCPYCGTRLTDEKPFSRLILQTESGESWESDIVLETNNLRSSSLASFEMDSSELYFWHNIYRGTNTKVGCNTFIKSFDNESSPETLPHNTISLPSIRFPKYVPN